MDGSGSVVVLPGLGGDLAAWGRVGLAQLDLPAGGVQIYTYPGWGDRAYDGHFDLADLADDVVSRYPGRLEIVGAGAGVAVAAEILRRHGDRVGSLAAVCAGFGAPTSESARAAAVQTADTARREGMVAVADSVIRRWFTPAAFAAEAPVVQYARRCLLDVDPEAWSSMWTAMARREPFTDDQFAAIDQPVSLVAAVHDATGSVRRQERLQPRLARARLMYVAGPHMLYLERPANFAGAIDQHLLWYAMGAPERLSAHYYAG